MSNEQNIRDSEHWLQVDKAFLKVRRITFSLTYLIGLIITAVFTWLFDGLGRGFGFALIALLVLSFIWVFFIFAPKSYARIRYLLREQDINFQKGYMFWAMVSVAHNRIQHLEVSQGPLERHYGLATLMIYTAGMMGANLKIPGLTLVQAQQLKAQLLNSINAENVDTENADINEPL